MNLDDATLAQLRILVAVAKADGRLDAAEEQVLVERVGPEGASQLLTVLAETDIDLETEIAKLDDAQRRHVYRCAYAVTHADGHASVEEVAMLRQILDDDGEVSLAGQIWGETKDTLVPGNILPIADPAQRDSEVTEDILKYSTIAAVAGAMPVPGVAIVADLAVIALQTKLVHDIARYHGEHTTTDAIRDLLSGVVGSSAVRIGLNQLARLIPVAGSVWGATTSFASTYAIGRVAQRFFDGGQQVSSAELKGLFEQAKAEGRETFATRKADVDSATQAHEPKLVQLAADLSSGRLSRADYDRQVQELLAS
ncbi:MAG: hypothetical protein AAGA48_23325 [Myxococcota bacterium]